MRSKKVGQLVSVKLSPRVVSKGLGSVKVVDVPVAESVDGIVEELDAVEFVLLERAYILRSSLAEDSPVRTGTLVGIPDDCVEDCETAKGVTEWPTPKSRGMDNVIRESSSS